MLASASGLAELPVLPNSSTGMRLGLFSLADRTATFAANDRRIGLRDRLAEAHGCNGMSLQTVSA